MEKKEVSTDALTDEEAEQILRICNQPPQENPNLLDAFRALRDSQDKH